MRIEFTAPVKIESVNVTRDRHWSIRKRRASEQHEAVRYAALAAGWMVLAISGDSPKPPCVVTITRIAPRALDSDNAIAGSKHVRDEIARLLGTDDNHPNIEWRYTQERGKPKEYAARIRIESSDETRKR